MLPSGIKLVTFYLWRDCNELPGPDRFRWKLCLQINYRPKFHFVYSILLKLKLTRENIVLPNILDYQSYNPTVEKREKNHRRPLQLTEFDVDLLALSTRMCFHVFVLFSLAHVIMYRLWLHVFYLINGWIVYENRWQGCKNRTLITLKVFWMLWQNNVSNLNLKVNKRQTSIYKVSLY